MRIKIEPNLAIETEKLKNEMFGYYQAYNFTKEHNMDSNLITFYYLKYISTQIAFSKKSNEIYNTYLKDNNVNKQETWAIKLPECYIFTKEDVKYA